MISEVSSKSATSLLSIVIPTSRYSPHLIKFARYLREVCLENDLEIVVVSTSDNPANKLYKKLCNRVNCRLIIVERRPGEDTRAKQTNTGVTCSTSEYVYIIGDDMFVNCSFLKSLKKILLEEKPDAVLHAALPYPISIWAKVRFVEKYFSSYNLLQSSSRILRRALFIDIGGYREELVVGEDIEFHWRLLKSSTKIAVITVDKGFEVHLEEFKTLNEYILRAYNYGKHLKKLLAKVKLTSITASYVIPPLKFQDALRVFRHHYPLYVFYRTFLLFSALIGHLSSFLEVRDESR
jgi:glycosyltransferase involved in cell wall biosynthesis